MLIAVNYNKHLNSVDDLQIEVLNFIPVELLLSLYVVYYFVSSSLLLLLHVNSFSNSALWGQGLHTNTIIGINYQVLTQVQIQRISMTLTTPPTCRMACIISYCTWLP